MKEQTSQFFACVKASYKVVKSLVALRGISRRGRCNLGCVITWIFSSALLMRSRLAAFALLVPIVAVLVGLCERKRLGIESKVSSFVLEEVDLGDMAV